MSRKLTLIRGLPGSGKSTIAKMMVDDNPLSTIHFEADMFFVKDGEYKFDPTKLKNAHLMCQNQARYHLGNDKNVVIANTFTMVAEMQPYLDMDYASIEIIHCTGKYDSIHNVPEHTIQQMKDRWENYVLLS